MKVKVKELECKRCGHRWVPRKEQVRICPKCKSAYWDVDKIILSKPIHPHPSRARPFQTNPTPSSPAQTSPIQAGPLRASPTQ